ncbi:hypothetical protein GCM10009691_36310 [Brevibacterium picturae]|uniref:Uncharacterized protein n=1 Tax=Brevibacterium picturae TaxID=260553 RepID=A0ABN2CJB1_9MICO
MTVGLVEEAAKGDYELSSLQSVFSAAATAPVWLWEREQAELRPRTGRLAEYRTVSPMTGSPFSAPSTPQAICD